MSYDTLDEDQVSLRALESKRTSDEPGQGMNLDDIELGTNTQNENTTQISKSAELQPIPDTPPVDSNITSTSSFPRNATMPSFPRVMSSQRAEIFEDQQWEDIRPSEGGTFSLRNQKKEAAVICALLLAGLICVSVGIYKGSEDDAESAAALMLVGAVVLLPGLYYTFQLIRAWRANTEFRIWR